MRLGCLRDSFCIVKDSIVFLVKLWILINKSIYSNTPIKVLFYVKNENKYEDFEKRKRKNSKELTFFSAKEKFFVRGVSISIFSTVMKFNFTVKAEIWYTVNKIFQIYWI